ncbi:lipopolysaccharide assembly protein B [Sulfurimicrobium lacus]|uniref:Lipopolysaccharide assembly protein B n=1 Tax=Sulfurimicrobium lacus TaxID=2715678 RepID=A0A6F8VA32_9PROT|nr:lipopolysaccharide assembly protein LapB [Sulfurimicrobium lacus]BCB25832.1 lipopolysaccharide assembly protein B [Sulfurimicrobium lacus]
MEFEYWWLLALPLFFSLGWLAARIDIKHIQSESRNLPDSYFRGLNFLLNEQQDKAIESFIEVVRADPETVELHFALGSLFRRRGEVERATRMHQTLVARTDLDADKKLKATFELGQDYLKAGLLDRAEQVFSGMSQSAYGEQARKFLLEIYEQEREWENAIAIAQQLSATSPTSFQREIAQFYCELAASEIARSALDAARSHLEQALQTARACARANLMLGDMEAQANRHASAIQFWKLIETQNPAYLPLAAGRLLASYRALGQNAEGLALLRNYLAQAPSIDLLSTAFQAALEQDGPRAAYELVRDELRRNPSLLGLDKLLEAALLDAPAERRQDIALVKNLIHQHSQRLALYRCENCGFKARQFHWHCPACGGWESFPPKRTEDQDLT